MRWLLGLTMLLMSSSVAQAALFICGDTTTFFGALYADPSQPPTTCPAPYSLHQIAKATTAAQQGVIDSQPKRYLKVVEALVVEKTVGEKAAADQVIADAVAAAAALAAERLANEVCSGLDLTAIDAFIDARETSKLAQLATVTATNQAAITGLSGTVTLTMLKNALGAMNTHVETVATELLEEQTFASKKIARCLRAILTQ